MTDSLASVTSDSPVDLETFRVSSRMSYRQLADLIGVRQEKQARSYALGHSWPRSGKVLDMIVERSNGRVSIDAMHRRRSEFQRQESLAATRDASESRV